MGKVAVVAHSGKSFGGGLRELRAILATEGVTHSLWYEVKKLGLGKAAESPFVEVTRAETISIRFDRKLPYELDGGARAAVREMRIQGRSGSIKICVPPKVASVSTSAAGDEHA